MTDGDFYELAIHTSSEDVPALRDRTAGQVLLKLAALDKTGGHEGIEMKVRYTTSLGLELVTPLGIYTFVLDSDSDHLVVEQVT